MCLSFYDKFSTGVTINKIQELFLYYVLLSICKVGIVIMDSGFVHLFMLYFTYIQN